MSSFSVTITATTAPAKRRRTDAQIENVIIRSPSPDAFSFRTESVRPRTRSIEYAGFREYRVRETAAFGWLGLGRVFTILLRSVIASTARTADVAKRTDDVPRKWWRFREWKKKVQKKSNNNNKRNKTIDAKTSGFFRTDRFQTSDIRARRRVGFLAGNRSSRWGVRENGPGYFYSFLIKSPEIRVIPTILVIIFFWENIIPEDAWLRTVTARNGRLHALLDWKSKRRHRQSSFRGVRGLNFIWKMKSNGRRIAIVTTRQWSVDRMWLGRGAGYIVTTKIIITIMVC